MRVQSPDYWANRKFPYNRFVFKAGCLCKKKNSRKISEIIVVIVLEIGIGVICPFPYLNLF